MTWSLRYVGEIVDVSKMTQVIYDVVLEVRGRDC